MTAQPPARAGHGLAAWPGDPMVAAVGQDFSDGTVRLRCGRRHGPATIRRYQEPLGVRLPAAPRPPTRRERAGYPGVTLPYTAALSWSIPAHVVAGRAAAFFDEPGQGTPSPRAATPINNSEPLAPAPRHHRVSSPPASTWTSCAPSWPGSGSAGAACGCSRARRRRPSVGRGRIPEPGRATWSTSTARPSPGCGSARTPTTRIPEPPVREPAAGQGGPGRPALLSRDVEPGPGSRRGGPSR